MVETNFKKLSSISQATVSAIIDDFTELVSDALIGVNKDTLKSFSKVASEAINKFYQHLSVENFGPSSTKEISAPLPFFGSISIELVVLLRDLNLPSSTIVDICRLLEKAMIKNILANEADEDIQLAQIKFFIDNFAKALIDSCLKIEINQYQKKLREANRYILLEKRRYYTIFSRMIEPAFIIDNNMCLVDSNRAFDSFFGLKDRSHLGKLCYEVMGEDVCAACALREMLGRQSSFKGVEAVIPLSEGEKTVLFSGTFLGEINNEFTGGIISIQDITKRKETENALQESEEHYRTLIENVPDVTWRSDQDGNLVFVSPNLHKVCGYLPEEISVAGSNDRFSKVHPQDVDRVRNEFGLFFASHLPTGGYLRNLLRQQSLLEDDELIVDGQKKYDVKYRFRKKNGQWIWVHERANKIFKKDGVWYTDGVFTDITNLKMAEDELERHHFRMAEIIDERTAELREANKHLEKEVRIRRKGEQELLELTARLKISNEELEQFAHIASHDIKEPLILVLAFSKRLLDKYAHKLDEKGVEYIVRLAKAAEQLKCLVDDLLELSRISSSDLKYETVDLTSLVQDVVQSLEEQIKSVGGNICIAENLGRIDGDPVQLRQLFQNIITNALKYCHESKKPSVEIKKGDFVGSNLAEIIVEDNGIGFDSSLADQIFKPFSRLHRQEEYEGTGMGLATCKKIVVRHGGEIIAKSTVGAGSTFIVRLPVKTKQSNRPT